MPGAPYGNRSGTKEVRYVQGLHPLGAAPAGRGKKAGVALWEPLGGQGSAQRCARRLSMASPGGCPPVCPGHRARSPLECPSAYSILREEAYYTEPVVAYTCQRACRPSGLWSRRIPLQPNPETFLPRSRPYPLSPGRLRCPRPSSQRHFSSGSAVFLSIYLACPVK